MLFNLFMRNTGFNPEIHFIFLVPDYHSRPMGRPETENVKISVRVMLPGNVIKLCPYILYSHGMQCLVREYVSGEIVWSKIGAAKIHIKSSCLFRLYS